MRVASRSLIDVPRWECFDLIASERIGRVCIIDRAGVPVAFPVNYAVATVGVGRMVVFRVEPTSSIAEAVGPASLEVDRIEPELGRAWSVIVKGRLREVYGPGLVPDPEPWADMGRHTWLALQIDSI